MKAELVEVWEFVGDFLEPIPTIFEMLLNDDEIEVEDDGGEAGADED